MAAEDFFADSPSERALMNGARMGEYTVEVKTEALVAARSAVASDVATPGTSIRTALDGVYAHAESWLNVKDYGAVGDGVTDDTTAIQTALAEATTAGRGMVYLPPGRYLVSDTLLVTSKVHLAGAGADVTVITSASDVLTTVQSRGQTPSITGLTITKDVNPGATGYGIDAGETSSGSLISDVNVEKHRVGIRLGGTGLSRMQNVSVQWCSGVGVLLSNEASTVASLQWYLTNVLSSGNSGDGFRVQSFAGKGTTSVGKLSHCYTFANSGRGFIAYAPSSSDRIESIRITECFFGQDGNDEIYLDTHGEAHQITNTFLELAGSIETGPGVWVSSGSTVTAPASNTGFGLAITGNNTGVIAKNLLVVRNSKTGIWSQGADVLVDGCLVYENGRASSAGLTYGIHIAAGDAIVTGNRCRNRSGSTQTHGTYFATTSAIHTNNDLRNNATAATGGSTPTVNANNRTS